MDHHHRGSGGDREFGGYDGSGGTGGNGGSPYGNNGGVGNNGINGDFGNDGMGGSSNTSIAIYLSNSMNNILISNNHSNNTDLHYGIYLVNSSGNKVPDNFKIINKPMDEILDETSVLLYSGSTTCIEALAYGAVPINIISEYLIDLDQLKRYPDSKFSAKNPEEIKKYVEIALNKKQKEQQKIVNEIFSAPDEKTLLLAIS